MSGRIFDSSLSIFCPTSRSGRNSYLIIVAVEFIPVNYTIGLAALLARHSCSFLLARSNPQQQCMWTLPSRSGYDCNMSTTEILAELPKLDPKARSRIFQRLCELQEADLLQGTGPTPEERQILDEALAEFRRDGDTGTPWRDVIARLAGAEGR